MAFFGVRGLGIVKETIVRYAHYIFFIILKAWKMVVFKRARNFAGWACSFGVLLNAPLVDIFYHLTVKPAFHTCIEMSYFETYEVEKII